jgi:hypothetical protein
VRMRPFLVCFALAVVLLAGCSTLTLKPADYSWPVEQAVKLDAKGDLEIKRYSLTINMKNLLFEETGDSTSVAKWTILMIRDERGFYYVTAERFKNVYLFASADGAMKLHEKIQVNEKGITDPAFNLRSPYIQLVQSGSPALTLTPDGIREGGAK